DRYFKLRTLASALYSRIGDLQSGERSARWSDVNFASNVPGWTRYVTADEWLARKKKEPPSPPSAAEISAVRAQMKGAAAEGPVNAPKLAEDNAPDKGYIKWKESQVQ